MPDTHNALLPMAPGSEEMEVVIIADVLRRAGINVTLASCCPDQQLTITASRGVKLVADCLLETCAEREFALIVLPGGMPGAELLRDHALLTRMLHQQEARKGWLAAICAAPAVVLQHHGLLSGCAATCHPAFQQQLAPAQCRPQQPVVIDAQAQRVTSQAPGTAMAFALALVELLCGHEMARAVAEPMVTAYQPRTR